jgi:hypothetical protein
LLKEKIRLLTGPVAAPSNVKILRSVSCDVEPSNGKS